MKRKRLNLLLAAAAVGLAVAVYFSREKPAPPPPPLTTLKVEDVNRIRVLHAGKPDIRLEKRNGTWWLAAPVETRADAVEVNGILDLVDRESTTRYPAAEMKLAELGLENPAWRVQLNDVEIALGNIEPLEARRYARVGDTVHLIQDPPSAALDADYSDLVSKHLLPQGGKLDRIQLPRLSLQRNAKGGWSVEPKSADIMGADAAQRLVDVWSGAQAMWVARSNAPSAGRETVTVKAGDEEFRFVIVQRKDQLVLARPDIGVTFTLPKTLDPGLFELQEPAKAEAKTEKPADRP